MFKQFSITATCFVVIFLVANLSKAQVTAKTYSATKNTASKEKYTSINLLPQLYIIKDKKGKKYEIRKTYDLKHGLASYEYSIAKATGEQQSNCEEYLQDKTKWDECLVSFKKYQEKEQNEIRNGSRIIIFSGKTFGDSESCPDSHNKNRISIEKVVVDQKYLIKDFNKDGYDDIGFRFVEMDCETNQLETYEKILIAAESGFKVKEASTAVNKKIRGQVSSANH